MARRTDIHFPEHGEGKVPGLEEAFAVVLRRLRKRQNLSQEELALRSGLGRAFVSLLERSHRRPSLSTLYQMARALGVSPVEFLQAIDEELAKSNGR